MRYKFWIVLFVVSTCLAVEGEQQYDPLNPTERVILGKVTETDGKPLSNVEVILEYLGHPQIFVGLPSYVPKFKKSTRTSVTGEYKFTAKGEFSYKELPDGNYRLRFKVGPGRKERIEEAWIGPPIVSGPEGTGIYVREVNVQIAASTTPSPTPLPTPRVTPTPSVTPTPRIRPTPSPQVSPDSTPSPSPELPLSEIDRILKNFDWGNIAFNVPPSMSLNEAKKVELLLGPSYTEDELKKMVEEKVVEGNIKTERIQISDQMEAILAGDGFTITKVTPERRAVSKTAVTEWKWDVTAIKSGRLRLHLILNALVKIEGVEQPYTIRTFDKEYFIDVPWQEKPFFSFIGRNWQWLWTTLFIPIVAWLWNRKRKRVRKAGFV